MVYNPDRAIHPGYILARSLDREGMTQRNLSARTGLTDKHISQIINGEASITVDTALILENVLGGSSSFWINLEKNFQETKARLERVVLLRGEISLMTEFPYSELVKRSYVEKTNNAETKIENLLKFFGVNFLTFVRETEAVAYRKRAGVKMKSESIASWLRCGELEAKQIAVSSFSNTSLKQSIDELRKLTLKEAGEYSAETRNILSESGVALVYVPHFPRTSVNGAVRWVNDVPTIQLSLLGACADMFWFTLFHEIGHLLLHGKKEKFLEFQNDKDNYLSGSREKEKEADVFASNALIPQKLYADFIQIDDFSNSAIVEFAKNIKIHPGVVAGRLCHDEKIKWRHAAGLRTRLKFITG